MTCPACNGLGHSDRNRTGSLCPNCGGSGRKLVERGMLIDAVDQDTAALEKRIRELESDHWVLMGALGYAVPADTGSTLSTGMQVKCGMCDAKGRVLEAAQLRSSAVLRKCIDALENCRSEFSVHPSCAPNLVERSVESALAAAREALS